MEDTEFRPRQLSPLVPRAPLAAGPLGPGPRAVGPIPAGPGARPAVGAGAHPAKAKPDARPMRVAFFAGGLAAVSALLAAIVIPAKPAVVTTVTGVQQQQQTTPLTTGTPISVQQPIQYIQLLPGQTAPPGAIVVDPSGPRPTSVVISVPAPAQKGAAAQKPIIIRTTQSGKVIP